MVLKEERRGWTKLLSSRLVSFNFKARRLRSQERGKPLEQQRKLLGKPLPQHLPLQLLGVLLFQ